MKGATGPPASESSLQRNVENTLRELWARLFEAGSRVVVMMVLIGIHKGLSWLGKEVVPQGWRNTELFFDATLFIAFAVIYVSLLWELVALVPGLRGRRAPEAVSQSSKGSTET